MEKILVFYNKDEHNAEIIAPYYDQQNGVNRHCRRGWQEVITDMRTTASKETVLVLIKFKVRGNLRFLSHAETVNLFQRACARAGIEVLYSQGFNPRPKMSLPLPRTVGIESDDDLLCLRLLHDPSEPEVEDYQSQIKARLSSQLPEGCELLTVRTIREKTSFEPVAAKYILTVQRKYINEKLKSRIDHLLASESLNIERRIYPKNSKFKNVDVRPFLKSIELDDRNIAVECEITSSGSIRVDEILKLLELNVEILAAPVRRTSVKWQKS